MRNKIQNEKIKPNINFNVKYLGNNYYLIKFIEKGKYLNEGIESKNLILPHNDNEIKLNLIDINEKDNNSKTDCIIMEYDINNEKSFEEIKLLLEKKLKKMKILI